VVAVAVLFELAAAAVRPFYVELARAEGASLAGGAVLFMLASAAALAVLPLARPLRRRLGPALLPTALAAGAAGLLLQALAPDLATMTGARILFGAGLGLGQVALDLRMFAVVGTAGPGFAAVETARAGALLAAPVLAAATASASLALPLVAGAALLAVAAAVSPLLCPSPLTEEPRDLRFSR
jgi:MFS family permease